MSNKIGVKAGQKSIAPSKPSSKKIQPNTTVNKASKPTAKVSTAKTKPAVKKPVKKQEQPANVKPKKPEVRKELSGLSVKLMGDGISIRWSSISEKAFDSLTKKGNLSEVAVWQDFQNNSNVIIGGNANESCCAEIDFKVTTNTINKAWLVFLDDETKLKLADSGTERKIIPIDANQKLRYTTKIKAAKGKYLLVRVAALEGTYVSMSNPAGKTIKESDFNITIARVIAPDGCIYHVASVCAKNDAYLTDDGNFGYFGTVRYGWDIYDSNGKQYAVKFRSSRHPKNMCTGLATPYWRELNEGYEKEIAKSKIIETSLLEGTTAS